MLNQIRRVLALTITVIGFGICFAQSDDGTLLSPNLPLPAPLHFLPIGIKPQAAPTPSSAQPVVPPVVAVATPTPIAKPPAASVVAPTASSPVSAREPAAKPAEAPSGLIMPISISPSTNVAKPIAATPVPARVVAVAPKPAPKPASVATTVPKPAPKPVVAAKPKPPAPKPVAVKPAPKPSPVVRATSSRSLLTITAKSTAYNSLANQTDSTPFVTATGARTRFGVVALSRDLLRRIPYGSIVRIEDLGNWGNGRGRGTYNRMLAGVNFVVEDTMNARKRNTVDVWMPTRRGAIQWGARQIRVTVIRLGRR